MIKSLFTKRPRINRRSFLRGTAGVALGLPFLESLPERSAWAAGEKPIFSLFICAVDGIVPKSFFPDALGPLTPDSLAAANKATSKLSAHAEDLLFVKNINWPAEPVSDPHVESLCMALTAVPWIGSNNNSMAGGPSADWVIAERVQPGTPPLTLYAGNVKNGWVAERLSFSSAEQVTRAMDNPYALYQQLMGIVSPDGTTTPDGEQAKRLLFESRKSIHDLVRDELGALLRNPRMSSADKQRLQLHLDAVRDIETGIGNMGEELTQRCSERGLELDRLRAQETTFKYNSRDGWLEDIVRLHLSLVALAFACNYNRTATLQWGDAIDATIYPVPANESLDWRFNHISHRVQSDSATGNNPVAAQAHAEIDVVRMQTLAAGLDHFKARGLVDDSFVLWTNGLEDGPTHSFRNLPHIIWGNAGGYLKQGAYVDSGGSTNNRLLNTLISAAIRDTGETMEDFGEGPVAGQLPAMLA